MKGAALVLAMMAAVVVPVASSAQESVRVAPTRPIHRVVLDDPVSTFGGAGAAGSPELTQIAVGRLLPSGEVVLVDVLTSGILVFGHDGSFLRQVGRRGQGPEEFGAPPAIEVAEGGAIWAWDPGNVRRTRWAVDGSLLQSDPPDPHHLQGVPSSTIAGSWDVSTAGLVMSRGGRTHRARGEVYREPRNLVLFHDASVEGPLDIGGGPNEGLLSDGIFALESPFLPPRFAELWGGGVVEPQPGPWRLVEYGWSGSPVRVWDLPNPSVDITPSLVSREVAVVEARHPNDPGFARLLERADHPHQAEAIRKVLATSGGDLWVQRWAPSDEIQKTYDVLSVDGEWWATVTVSGEVIDARGPLVLTSRLDSFDVPVIEIYSDSSLER